MSRIGPIAALTAAVLVAACSASPTPAPSASAPVAEPSASVGSPAIGEIVPAPGSDSRLYAPNPAAIVVAIDPGHGGCLDWGVPNPYDNRLDRAEKTLTLAIGTNLRDQLEADGVTVVMTRDADVALAGDDYPQLGCTGDPFRDVNGDGMAGFGPDYPEATRTRDELSARIDLVNLARADVMVAIHINSFTENGVVIEIAGTETFWTDETSWGVAASKPLASAIQEDVVAALAGVASYDRQDRGIDAVNYYVIAPPTSTGDPREPRRGILMPGVLTEVGSMSLAAEADLLATEDAQTAIASAVSDALATWFGSRPLAARLDVALAGGQAGTVPPVQPGEGPLYWAPTVSPDAMDAPSLTITNTGTEAWTDNAILLAGWELTDEPYLAQAPGLAPLDVAVPPLQPGQAVVVPLRLPDPPAGGRSVAWVTVRVDGDVLSDLGSPPLQLATNE